ncbi:MAG: M67 family metallopeptidase [Candidatus Bathyarchaeota archaeon]|nr:M67 family metallopeptidase [Candidatus Bathyarchaeota archaeon]
MQQTHVDLLRNHANDVHPVEAVALLFGDLPQNEAVVKTVTVVANRLGSVVKFEVDPEIVVSAFMDAEKQGYEFIGLFHSHPAPAVPSAVDLKSMKLWGDAIWLILSTTDGELGAYQLTDGNLEKVTVITK